MKRTAEKLAAEARAIARSLAARVAALPDDADPGALAHVEMALRDAVVNRLRASIEIGDISDNERSSVAS